MHRRELWSRGQLGNVWHGATGSLARQLRQSWQPAKHEYEQLQLVSKLARQLWQPDQPAYVHLVQIHFVNELACQSFIDWAVFET
jgi:hypothetical protein